MYATTSIINAIVEDVHATATRCFDVLEMRFPPDEWRVLRVKMEHADIRSRRLAPTEPIRDPFCIEIFTVFGIVRISEEQH